MKYYGFGDVIPVSIFGGKISVDFAKITKYLSDQLGFDPGNVK